MTRLVCFFLLALYSCTTWAFDFSGHWRDSQNGSLICDNGYTATCATDQYLLYDGSQTESDFLMRMDIACATPDAIQLGLRTSGRAVVREGSRLVWTEPSYYRQCGSISANSMTLECQNDFFVFSSNYFAVTFVGNRVQFDLNSKGNLEYAIPIKIFQVKCQVKGEMSPMFP